MDIFGHLNIDKALRIMEVSKASLAEDSKREREPDQSIASKIFRTIKEMRRAAAGRGGDASPHRLQREPVNMRPFMFTSLVFSFAPALAQTSCWGARAAHPLGDAAR